MSNLKTNTVQVVGIPMRGNVKDMLQAQDNKMKTWEEGDSDAGFIIGTAIRFIPWALIDQESGAQIKTDGVERIGIGGCFPHDYILSAMEHGEGLMAGAFDDNDTLYGFFTTNGFFVNRQKAMTIWKEMMKLSGWIDYGLDDKTLHLYSYHLKPEVVEHCEKIWKPEAAQA